MESLSKTLYFLGADDQNYRVLSGQDKLPD